MPKPSIKDKQLRELTQKVIAAENNAELFQERLAELELALEDINWARMVHEGNRELSREGLKRIMAMSRLFFLKNPIINRAVCVQAYYVWALGVNIEAEDDGVNDIIQGFMDDRRNKAELTSHQARTMKEMDLQVLGNLFLVLFPDRITGDVRVRSIPADELQEIITNPEDVKEPWYYKRIWVEHVMSPSGQPSTLAKTAYYPDWLYQPAPGMKRTVVGGFPVMWDSPVYHVRVGGLSDMRFGIPETYASLDWAKAYKEFLEDWATRSRAMARFAWSLVTKGGQTAINAAKAKLATTLATSSIITQDTNPPPVTASTAVMSEGVKLDPINVRGTQDSPEEGRQIKLMAAAGMGLPETFFADMNTSNLATAKALDRPTELKFRDRQTLWAGVLMDLLNYLIDWKIRAGKISENVDRLVKITFPPVLEHDILPMIQAIVQAATLGGYSQAGTIDPEEVARMLLEQLGRQDVDELLKKMNFAKPEDLPPQPTAEAMMVEAVRELRRAISPPGLADAAD